MFSIGLPLAVLQPGLKSAAQSHLENTCLALHCGARSRCKLPAESSGMPRMSLHGLLHRSLRGLIGLKPLQMSVCCMLMSSEFDSILKYKMRSWQICFAGSANEDLREMAELSARDGFAVLVKFAARLAHSLLQLQVTVCMCQWSLTLHQQHASTVVFAAFSLETCTCFTGIRMDLMDLPAITDAKASNLSSLGLAHSSSE